MAGRVPYQIDTCSEAVVVPVTVQVGDLDADLASLRIDASSLDALQVQAVHGITALTPGLQVEDVVVEVLFAAGSNTGRWVIDQVWVQDSTGLSNSKYPPGDYHIEVLPCAGPI